MKREVHKKFEELLSQIYPAESCDILQEITQIIRPIRTHVKPISQEDIILTTYPNHIYSESTKSLKILTQILNNDFSFVNTIHILPFHPSTSDYGFSITDYVTVDSKYGDWNDIENLSRTKNIMSDVVLNHVSQSHKWFKKCQEGDLYYKQFFYIYDSVPFKPSIFRARTTPLFSPKLIEGKKNYVWTTFSQDQVDINYSTYHPLIHFLRIIKNYALHGITRFRLDAIAYIIKEKTGVHQEKTFVILEVLTLFIKELHNNNVVIPEVNFSMEQNIKYLEKSDAIYHFELPSLLLYTFHTQNSTTLTRWLSKNETLKNKHILQFTSTHDGVALLGIRKILPRREYENFLEHIKKRGGIINYKKRGTEEIAYEANGLFQNMVDNTKSYINAKLITLCLKGIPLFYFSDFFALNNWHQGYEKTKQARALSRQTFSLRQYEIIKEFLSEPFEIIKHAANIRTQEKAFHPNSKQEIVHYSKDIIYILRTHEDETICCLTNISNNKQKIHIGCKSIDILTQTKYDATLTLSANQSVWCKLYQ